MTPLTPFFRQRCVPRSDAARSLAWRGDDLVDWLTEMKAPERFNHVITDASGRWAVLHARRSTHGMLAYDGNKVRDLTRERYHADDFDYAACLFKAPGDDERMLLAYCPEHYGTVEIEDAATGERLSTSAARAPRDFFHSRLSSSPNSKRLLTAGWVWHPWDAVGWIDVEKALADPTVLDNWEGADQSTYVGLAEESSAAWLNDEILVIGSSTEAEDKDTAAEVDAASIAQTGRTSLRLPSLGIATFDAASRACIATWKLGYPPGTMMAAGFDHVVTFFNHPRLVSLVSGEVVHEWIDLESGEQISSLDRARTPPLALDPLHGRFAVADRAGRIDVVELDLGALPVNAVEAALRSRHSSNASEE
jgi:hypothetical protein